MKPERVLEIWNVTAEPFIYPHQKILAFAAAIEAELLAGKCLVPVEPTEAMIEAAEKCATLNGGWLYVSTKAIWREMLQAAPKGGE